MKDLYNYYQDEINKLGNVKNDFAPNIKIEHANGKTKWLSLNDDSASVIVKFLSDNFNITDIST